MHPASPMGILPLKHRQEEKPDLAVPVPEEVRPDGKDFYG